jgi:hypothetical protein
MPTEAAGLAEELPSSAFDSGKREQIIPLIHEGLRLSERARDGVSEKNRMFVE